MLKNLRLNQNLTQKQLANMLNTTTTAISYHETGKRQPPLNKISALAKALKVSEIEIINALKVGN